MAIFHPWGSIDWLLPRMGTRDWSGVFCSSFEPRCLGVPEWLGQRQGKGEYFSLRIVDPPSDFSTEIEQITTVHENEIRAVLGGKVHAFRDDLLAESSVWNGIVNEVASAPGTSVLLDISTLPKRVFLFMVKRFLAHKNVDDFVVCYARPAEYKEGGLTEDAQPPSALPGYSRISSKAQDSTVIVSVGYMGFNLSELLEQQRGRAPKFLFPFPPSSPGFRRSWRLLHELTPDPEIETEIKRIHATDMFAALDWLRTLATNDFGNIDMVPLGPKPHALAMALAYPHMGDGAEIVYSQPTLYHPNYSTGIRRVNGVPDITAYCLRRAGRNFV